MTVDMSLLTLIMNASFVVKLVMLALLLFHSVTWFNLAPKALVVRLGRRRIPDALVLSGHYAAWLAATALVIWLVAR